MAASRGQPHDWPTALREELPEAAQTNANCRVCQRKTSSRASHTLYRIKPDFLAIKPVGGGRFTSFLCNQRPMGDGEDPCMSWGPPNWPPTKRRKRVWRPRREGQRPRRRRDANR